MILLHIIGLIFCLGLLLFYFKWLFEAIDHSSKPFALFCLLMITVSAIGIVFETYHLINY